MERASMSTPGPDPEVTDQEILAVMRQRSEPFVTAPDVAQAVGLSRQRARLRLERLKDEGKIERAKVGGNAVVYWIPDDGH